MHDERSDMAITINNAKGYLIDMLHDSKESYFITVTLKPKLYKFTSITQFELTHSEIIHIMDRHAADYVVATEHTKQGNIHYHVVAYIPSTAQKITMINMLKKNRLFGFIKFDPKPITHRLQCVEYMTKDLYQTLKVFPVSLRWKVIQTFADGYANK